MDSWLRLVRVAECEQQASVKHLLLYGQIVYETTRDIQPGEELLLERKVVINLDAASISQESLGDSSDGYSTGEDHKGVEYDQKETSRHQCEEETGQEASVDEADDDDIQPQCLQCDKTFTDSDTLDEHLVTTHSYPAGRYQCEYCPRAYAWRPSLIQHKTVHGQYKHYNCENCTKVFTDSALLAKHIRTAHPGSRAHVCPECGKTFQTSSGLKQHTHIHSSVKPFQCEVCCKSYTQFSNLCRHKRMHANCRLSIKCQKCHQAFTTGAALVKHKRFCDTAPSMSIPNVHPNVSDFKKLPMPPNYNIAGLPPSHAPPIMMYPSRPPPLPLLPQTLLGNYPMFSTLPSLVGGPHHSLIPPSLLLPFQNEHLLPKRDIIPNEITTKDLSDSSLTGVSSSAKESLSRLRSRSPVVEKTDEKIKELQSDMNDWTHNERFHLPSSYPQDTSIDDDQVSLNNSADFSENPHDRSDLEELSQSSPPQRCTPSPQSPKFSPTKKESTPLDLTMRRGDMEILSVQELSTSMSSPDDNNEKALVQNVTSNKSEVRTEHSFLSISDLLKDNIPKHATPSVPPVEKPTKYPLANPRPLYPNYLFDMCRNFERNQERPPLIPSSLPPRSYPLMSPFLPPSTMSGLSGMNLNLTRNSSLDILKAQISANTRPYSELSRPYEIMSPHIARQKDKYTCKFCEKNFPRSANLTRHLRTHTGEQPYTCKYCERAFSISSNLQRHVRNIHNKEKPFKCPFCKREFAQQTNLDRHLRNHEEAGCEVPDSSSASETTVKYSMDEIKSFVDKVTDSNNEEQLEDNDIDDDDKSFDERQESL